MTYKLTYDFNLSKFISKIPKKDAQSIKDKLEALREEPRPMGVEKLSGKSSYRVRVRNYRIVYEIFDSKLVVLVLTIGDRKEVYKKK